MKKLKKIELTLNQMRTLVKAKILLDKISPTDTYYVEFWKELKFIRLNTTDSSKRGFTFNLSAKDYGRPPVAREMWTREEVRQNKKWEYARQFKKDQEKDYQESVHDYNTGEK